MSQSQRRQYSQIAAEPPSQNQQQLNGRGDMWDQAQALLGFRVAPNSAQGFNAFFKRYDPFWSSNPESMPNFFPDDLPPRPLCWLPAVPECHWQYITRLVAGSQRRFYPVPIMAHPRPSKVLPDPRLLASGQPVTFQQPRTFSAPTPATPSPRAMSQIASTQPTPRLEPPAARLFQAGPSAARNNDSGGTKLGAEIGADRESLRPGPYVPQPEDPGRQRMAPHMHSPMGNPQNPYAHLRSVVAPVDQSPRRKVNTMGAQLRSVDPFASVGSSTSATTETGTKKRKKNSRAPTAKKPRSSISRAS